MDLFKFIQLDLKYELEEDSSRAPNDDELFTNSTTDDEETKSLLDDDSSVKSIDDELTSGPPCEDNTNPSSRKLDEEKSVKLLGPVGSFSEQDKQRTIIPENSIERIPFLGNISPTFPCRIGQINKNIVNWIQIIGFFVQPPYL